MNSFLTEALTFRERLQDLRRDIHREPELGMNLRRTAGRVAAFLEELGISIRTGVGGSGVVGLLRRGKGGRTVAMRADMDALPVQDAKTVSYASARSGRCHACGHDAHTAMLLGAAALLAGRAERLNGNVKFIFEPSEEMPPGGALPMIADGALEDPRPEAMLTLHVNPEIPEGELHAKAGFCTMSSAGFRLIFIGKSGHVATPHKAIDPIVMAAGCVSACQNIISRRTNPMEPAILAFGSIHGGGPNNVIPERVTLGGTVRGASPEALEHLKTLLTQTAESIAAMNGGDFELHIDTEYPSVYNDPSLVSGLLQIAGKVVGADRTVELHQPFPGGEDVAYFHREVPGVLAFLGVRNPVKGFIHPLHSPRFDLDDAAVLPLGAALHAAWAVSRLKSDGAKQ